MVAKIVMFGLCLIISSTFAQEDDQINLGRMPTGATVTFIQSTKDNWGVEISGGPVPRLMQLKPAQLEIFKSEDDIQKLTVAYKTLQKSASGIDAHVEISLDKKVVFRIMDHWSLKDNVVSVSRVVDVKGNAQGGFNSSVVLSVDPMISWVDVNCLAPGALYGDPTYNGEYSPGGTRNHTARQILLREDMLPAPLFALAFDNGSSVAVMDPSPNGASTVEETKLVKNIMIDKRFQFGAMGAWQEEEGPLEFGFQFPGSMSVYPFGPDASPEPRWFKRYHPITGGVVHKYKIDFRFGSNEFFRDMTRNAWRWAFDELNPSVKLIDVEQMRRVLTDHMAAQAATIDGRTGIPFAVATFDTSAPQWNWTMVVMGFVSKNLECADQMLRESDRDKTERGKKMREIGLSIISSMIQALSAVPLQASGYDLATGKPWTGDRQEWLAPFLRNATEGMRVLIRAYQRERELGRLHPEWFNWVKSYVDWLLQQQREDGSFPRRWKPGSNEVEEKTGTASYCPVPLLVLMTEETGDSKYKKAAIRAAEYVWENWGTRGFYVGGASDNPNITDKEAGMLSLEAFLSLYEVTGESKWLERAKAAADYTETWMWIWNLPMPVDADNAKLHWKKGVPTIGLQGITARGVGGVDEYMDWSAPSYAKLYKYTKDSHYLDVARILLHATKSMVALPGRQYGLRDIGFQQEHWRMGPGRSGRGIGGHRFWLPWVSANHLYSITGLEEFDPHLYRQLSEGE